MTDVTTEILQQLRADIREVRTEVHELRDSLNERMDGLEARQDVMEYALRGMSADLKLLPEVYRLVRQVAEDHEQRIQQLEGR